ncbi:MAG TPA: transposase [Aestuariivirga sp.]|nr:transposase [Aestuariivirga sp.]
MSKSTISTFELFQMFPDAEAARVYMEGKRWPDGAVCPACDEAKLVRARFRNKWGNLNSQTSGEDANARRKQESDARRNDLAERVLAFLAEGQMSSGELRDRLMVSENQTRNALGYLRKQGRADFFRNGSGSVWRKLEAAE